MNKLKKCTVTQLDADFWRVDAEGVLPFTMRVYTYEGRWRCEFEDGRCVGVSADDALDRMLRLAGLTRQEPTPPPVSKDKLQQALDRLRALQREAEQSCKTALERSNKTREDKDLILSSWHATIAARMQEKARAFSTAVELVENISTAVAEPTAAHSQKPLGEILDESMRNARNTGARSTPPVEAVSETGRVYFVRDNTTLDKE